jgi:hypothetical protein
MTNNSIVDNKLVCEHNWAVRNHKERRYLLYGDYYPVTTVYFCTKCLETKIVEEK